MASSVNPSPKTASHPSDREERDLSNAAANHFLDLLFFLVEYFPLFLRVSKPIIMWGTWRFAGQLRRGTLLNAARLLGDDSTDTEREALAKRVLANFFDNIYDLASALRLTRQALVEQVVSLEGETNYATARQARSGAIVVTAHLGPFELGAAALANREQKLHVVFQRDNIARFDRLRTRLREKLGILEAPVDGGLANWIKLRDALAADEVVMLQADRVMLGQPGVSVPFLGGHLLMPTGPVKLAIVTGAPIIPIFSVREAGGGIRVIIEDPIWVPLGPQRVDGDHPAIRSIARVVENHVRAHPDQWITVFPAWCEDAHVHEERANRAT
jgi:phosphatidylinositol dimannoside acyltransferase